MRIDLYGLEKLFFGDVLFAGVGDVNTARTNEKRLAPGTAKKRDVGGESDDGCWKTIEGSEADGRSEENFASFNARGGSDDSLPQVCCIANNAKHDFRAGFIGDDIGSAATGNDSDIQRGLAEERVFRKRNRPDGVQDVEQGMNGRVTEFGISGMSEFAVGNEFVTERAFAAQDKLILRGFTVDEKA